MMRQQKCVPQSIMIIMSVCDINIFIALLSNVPKGLIENEIAEIKDRFVHLQIQLYSHIGKSFNH